MKKRYKLRGCHVDLVSIGSSEPDTESEPEPEHEHEPVSEPEMYSKPGPLSTKRFIHIRKEPESPVPPPSVGSRRSRESISIDVVDEFVVDESSASSTTTPEVPDADADAYPKIAEVEDETDNEESSPEDLEVTVTKSGRKVMKPKMQNFIVTNTKKLNKSVDSESEAEEEDRVLSQEKIKELKQSLPETFLPGDLAWARLGVAPYWPCTITLDPDQEIHSNVSMKGKKAHREYHVQVGNCSLFFNIHLLSDDGVVSVLSSAY